MGKHIDGRYEFDENIPCPVCGEYTFEVEDDFDICPVCGWENESLQYQNPDYKGGANGVSLNEARKMWANGQRVWTPEDASEQ